MPARPRPLSPHLQIYRWQIGNTLSILHRFTGLALALGSIALAFWLVALAGGEETYRTAYRWFASPIGLLLLAGGAGLHVLEPVAEGGLTVSSTKVREFLLEGKVEAAALLLTRPHDLDGRVVPGAGRGRGLGFGTANLATEGLLPGNGVYAVRARLGGAGGWIPGVCNVGVKPTVDGTGRAAAEVHLLEHDGRDLYGATLRVGFVARLRDERRFPSLDALRAQIADDAGRARALLAGAG